MSSHISNVTAAWKGSFNGRGHVRSGGFAQTVTLPKEFHGLGEGASPEDLLLSALAGCFLITLGIMLDKNAIAYESLTVAAELETSVQPQPTIRSAVLKVRIMSNEDEARLQGLAEKAEKFCLIARAIEGNIAKRVELSVDRIVGIRLEAQAASPS